MWSLIDYFSIILLRFLELEKWRPQICYLWNAGVTLSITGRIAEIAVLWHEMTHHYAFQIVPKKFMSTLFGDGAKRENCTPRNNAQNLTNTASSKLNDHVSTKHKNNRKSNRLKIAKYSRSFEILMFSNFFQFLKRILYVTHRDSFSTLLKRLGVDDRFRDSTSRTNELHREQAAGYESLGSW